MSSGPRVPTGKRRFKVDGRLFSASLQSRRRWVASKNKPTRVPGAGGRAVVPSVAAGHLNCELDFVCPRETLSESATEGQRACGEVRREWTPIRTITIKQGRFIYELSWALLVSPERRSVCVARSSFTLLMNNSPMSHRQVEAITV